MTTMSVRTAAIWAIASQYTSFAIQFVTSVVLARWYINPADLGLFSIAFAAITLVAFLQDFGVGRYIAGERDLTDEKIETAFTLSIAVAWGVAFASILLAWPVSWFYHDPRLLPLALVIASSYLLVPLAIVPQALCQRRMDFKSNTMIEVGAAAANAVVALTLAVRGHGAMALAWGAFAQQAARMLVSQWRAGGMLPRVLRLRGAAPIVALGGTNTVQAVCASVTSRAPELLVGRILNEVAVGLFARATGLALQLRLLVSGAVTGVFYPAFRKVRDEGQPLGPPYLRVVAAYTGITWPAMAGIAVLAAPLVDLLYGPRWAETAPLLIWVALSQLCYVAVPLNGDLPILVGRMRQLVRYNIYETIASVLLLALAAPFGLVWVAASRVFHGIYWIAVYAPFMREIVDVSWRALLKAWGKSLVGTIAAIAPLLASYIWWAGPAEAGLGQIGLGVAAGVACWFVTLALIRHSLFGEIMALLGDARAVLVARRMAKHSR
jgi:O-antigen/teichoic acid export membrane protein